MIKKVLKLKKFGIYQNYTWGGIDDFKQKNLIYGWNYSGKTTLSKLFQVLEFKDKNKYFSGSEIEISIDDSGVAKTITQETIATFPFHVKVFNSEYIKRIFTWDDPKNGFNPISFYLGDPAGNLKDKIDRLETINARLSNLRDVKYKNIIDVFDAYEKQGGKFTDKAKDIRDNYLPGIFDQNKLNKSHIKEIADRVKANPVSHILSEEDRNKVKNEATAIKKFEPLEEEIAITENLKAISKKVKEIVEDTAPKAIAFPELDADTELFNWVQKGIALHVDTTECKFCTKELPPNRISDLNFYYSKKLKEIQDAISDVTTQISSEIERFNIVFPNKKEISDSFQSEYEEAIKKFEKTKKKYIKQFDTLSEDLWKKGNSMFVSLPSTDIEEVSFKPDFDAIEGVIKKHNEWLDKFEERKTAALTKILEHYIAEYLQTENYAQKEKDKESAKVILQQIKIKLDTNSTEIDNLNAQLSDKVKGQAELNTMLEILLHRDDIKIEIRNDKFTLERAGHPATDLSEGEKSAIAFAYFLTELKSLRDDDPPKLPKTIIFIDDPISSLDSNHIFQVRSLLKDFFKTTDFAQLFISTHNFEFFTILFDSGIYGKIKGDTSEAKRPIYFIKRDQNGILTIEKMPKSFSNYKSEYVGLFHILNDFNNEANKDDFPYLLLLPNALRRFVELYTLTKYPANNDSTVDQRVEIVFKSTEKPHHNIKLLNWFSHQNQIEKLQKHDEKIILIADAINDLIEYLKNNDVMHWNGLNGI